MKNEKIKGVVIKSDIESLRLITEFAKSLGAGVIKLTDKQLEDFLFVEILVRARKSGKADSETVMKRLNDSI